MKTDPVGAYDALSPEQKARLEALGPAAAAVLQSIEDKVVALTLAATTRWVPEQSVWDTSENGALVFGDDEYAEMLALIENVSSQAMFAGVAKFFDIPQNVIDTIVTDALKVMIVAPIVQHAKNNNSGNSRVVSRMASQHKTGGAP